MARYSTEQLRARKSYKQMLLEAVDGLPPGTRQQIARRLNASRSFVSQVLNPKSEVPLPASRLPEFMQACEFSQENAQQFLTLYETAHPKSYCKILESGPDSVTISLPRFATAEQRQAVIAAILAAAENLISVSTQTTKRRSRKPRG